MSRDEKNLTTMYGDEDLSLSPLFQGGFINFGYWEKLSPSLTPEERLKASQALYHQIFKRLDLKNHETVLEVGCGRGLGCQLLKAQHSGKVVGIDVTPAQIERARSLNLGIEFVESSAEALAFASGSFDAIYSVEAAQHFLSFEAFAKEAHRVLAACGKLVVTTFFAEDASTIAPLEKLIPTIGQKIDRVIPLDNAVNALNQAGFEAVQIERIGEWVWEGFDRWMAQRVSTETWGRHWKTAYQNQWLDYFILCCEKEQ